ncbi:ATPase [Microbacterium sp. NPDC089189]|uniref:ATPase n=1 Tax=Microbacterium sp. NPDC089189 TaxID=3154972 RepID=UPI003416C681
MKSLLWFVLGTSAGFVLAHLVNKDPRGHEVLADIDARITEFTDRIGDAYRDQQSRFVADDDAPDAAATPADTDAR